MILLMKWSHRWRRFNPLSNDDDDLLLLLQVPNHPSELSAVNWITSAYTHCQRCDERRHEYWEQLTTVTQRQCNPRMSDEMACDNKDEFYEHFTWTLNLKNGIFRFATKTKTHSNYLQNRNRNAIERWCLPIGSIAMNSIEIFMLKFFGRCRSVKLSQNKYELDIGFLRFLSDARVASEHCRSDSVCLSHDLFVCAPHKMKKENSCRCRFWNPIEKQRRKQKNRKQERTSRRLLEQWQVNELRYSNRSAQRSFSWILHERKNARFFYFILTFANSSCVFSSTNWTSQAQNEWIAQWDYKCTKNVWQMNRIDRLTANENENEKRQKIIADDSTVDREKKLRFFFYIGRPKYTLLLPFISCCVCCVSLVSFSAV